MKITDDGYHAEIQAAHDAGRAANRRGEDRAANPYRPHTSHQRMLAALWDRGWRYEDLATRAARAAADRAAAGPGGWP